MAGQEFSGLFIRFPAASQINHISYFFLIYNLLMELSQNFLINSIGGPLRNN